MRYPRRCGGTGPVSYAGSILGFPSSGSSGAAEFAETSSVSSDMDVTLIALIAAMIDAGWTEVESNDSAGNPVAVAADFNNAGAWWLGEAPSGLQLCIYKGGTPTTDVGFAASGSGAFSGGGNGTRPTAGDETDTTTFTLLPLGPHTAKIRVQQGAPWGVQVSVTASGELVSVIPSAGSTDVAIAFAATGDFFLRPFDANVIADALANK